ncbi:hypothetical protein I0C86_07610 [Plantactinospora sp. S1510]|uniref:Lipoprotein n=1 Tax=Plantactinospora alkalitolerans TaxID=2789879 RepID=A0ABS0GRY5_9ACTN|nr:hypothetical protein [Plantactinospora alkalitolerans]MBF9128851.1 hypothetical protein [Plantactinospora alkalitolerans]
MRRERVLLSLAGALLLGLGGCQGEPSSAAGEPPLGPVPTIGDAREITLPLDAYLAVTLKWHVPDLAINRLGRDCMRRLGLDWPVIGLVPPDSTAPRYGRRYGIFDADRAARHGYKPLPPANSASAGGEEGPRQEREPTEVETAVWTGRGESKVNGLPVPEGGCGAEALRALAGGIEQPPETRVELLADEAHQRAEQHSRMIATFERWSRCMSQRGFDYRKPSAANDDPRWNTEHATPAEIETAKADVACKLETNLVGVWYAAEVAYQTRAIEKNAARLQAVKDYHDAVQRNAAKVVTAG